MTETSQDQAAARPLRFGIMCRGHEFAAWEAQCIRNLMELEGVQPALLIVDGRPTQRRSRRERIAALFNPKTLLWRLYQRAVLNRQSVSTRPVDLSETFADVPLITVTPLQSGKFVERFIPEDVAEIRGHDLDFILRFAFNILRGDVLDAARYGIWSFHHGDPDKYRGVPPGFWEIYRGDPVTGTVLQRLTERLDSGIMLHKGYFRTGLASYPRSRDGLFFGAADFPARVCKDIRSGNAAALESEASRTAAPIYRTPNSLQMLRFLWVWARAKLANQVNSLFRFQQWSVGIIHAPIEQVAGLAGEETMRRLVRSARWLPEPRGRFLADPFAVPIAGGLTILAEDYDWSVDRGHITAINIAPDGGSSEPAPAIRLPCHLSYPYRLQLDGVTYCIPEAHESDEVALYRADAALREWTKVATLIEGVPVIDPTVFHYEDRWWLFGTRQDRGDNGKLFAWHARELTGPWQPHAANPLKTDIRSSRPAGPPFVHEGELFRPSQDCSTGYGAAVVVNRVTCLTPHRFEEEPASVVTPDPAGPYPSGLHTLCGAGAYTVIDGSRTAFVRAAAADALKRKLRRLMPKKN
jgi:hypothetical protein